MGDPLLSPMALSMYTFFREIHTYVHTTTVDTYVTMVVGHNYLRVHIPSDRVTSLSERIKESAPCSRVEVHVPLGYRDTLLTKVATLPGVAY